MNAPERFAEAAASPFLTPEHLAFRDMLRRFVATEIEPFAAQWDEAGEFPRELYVKAASIGLLQLGFPEEYGGVPCDRFMSFSSCAVICSVRSWEGSAYRLSAQRR